MRSAEKRRLDRVGKSPPAIRTVVKIPGEHAGSPPEAPVAELERSAVKEPAANEVAAESADDPERRRSPRYQTLIAASMPTDGRSGEMRCFILNVSDTGALLRPYSVLRSPSQFTLRPDIGEPRRCQVVWTNGEMLAVRFVREKTPAMSGREWAELGGDSSVPDLFLS